MAQVTITSVKSQRPWTSKQGMEFIAYLVDFEGPQGTGTAELSQKPETPAPSAGLSFDAEIVPSNNPNFPARLKKVAVSPNGRAGGKSPAEQAQIARMNSHAHALKYWELKHAADPAFRFESWADYVKVVDLFFNDVRKAGES